jgi:CMP/dCMP kinase
MDPDRSPRGLQIAIDGPAGSGKTTVARGVAGHLGLTYVDSGAMYRAVALAVKRRNLQDEESEWPTVARQARLEFLGPDGARRIHLDGGDVEDQIRSPEISEMTSRVSTHPGVRHVVTEEMKQMARQGGVVMEGRDIGTVVMPQAPVKIFLTAPAEERAARRAKELEARGQAPSAEDLVREIEQRDERDSSRAAAPLVKAADAVEIDTCGMTVDEVIDAVIRTARAKA